ncbi:hypothetical protein [Streptodolium elevatio]
MRTKLATAVGAAALIVVGIGGAQQASAAPKAAPQAGLSGSKTWGNTVGWATCSGTGTFRVKAICKWEGDKHTSWVTLRGGSAKLVPPACRFKIERIGVHQSV